MPVTMDRYPSDPGDPFTVLAERIRSLEQGLAELARANPLNSGMFHGTLRNVDGSGNTLGEWSPTGFALYDAAGNVVLRLDAEGLRMFDVPGVERTQIGRLGTDNYGVTVSDATGTKFWADEDGLHAPYLAVPTVDVGDFRNVTNGTFEATHIGQFEIVSHLGLFCWVFADCDSGTTGEIRLRNGATGAVTQAVAVTSAGLQQQFRWLHGATLGTGPVQFQVQARRTGGAGNVGVFRPPGFVMVDSTICVADGVP